VPLLNEKICVAEMLLVKTFPTVNWIECTPRNSAMNGGGVVPGILLVQVAVTFP